MPGSPVIPAKPVTRISGFQPLRPLRTALSYLLAQPSKSARIGFVFCAIVQALPLHADTDPSTGLVIAPGYEQVKAQCTACHSGRLVAQNRADRDGWLQMIRWMQDTQNLWPLGEAEPVILNYLAENYGPLPRGRRAPLDVSFE